MSRQRSQWEDDERTSPEDIAEAKWEWLHGVEGLHFDDDEDGE